MKNIITLVSLFTTISCASGGGPVVNEQGAATAVGAERRVSGSDTTWVARGPGYELAARSARDLIALKPSLDAQSRALRALFGTDPAHVVVVVRRVTRDGKPLSTPVHVPDSGPIVEATISEQFSDRGRESPGGRTPPPELAARMSMTGRLGAGTPTQNVVRAWLAARALAIAPTSGASGAAAVSVHNWVEDAVFGLAADSQQVDFLGAQLASQKDSLYTLGEFLVMRRPPYVEIPRPAAPEGGRGAMGGRGGSGGRGGPPPGGMGGLGGGGRMGRPPGGGMPGGPERAARGIVLQGAALFTAQAMVFGQYLASREGLPFMSALIEAQMKGTPIQNVLASATRITGKDLERLEQDWRYWIDVRARNTRR